MCDKRDPATYEGHSDELSLRHGLVEYVIGDHGKEGRFKAGHDDPHMRYVGGEVDGLNPQEVAEEEQRARKDWCDGGGWFEV